MPVVDRNRISVPYFWVNTVWQYLHSNRAYTLEVVLLETVLCQHVGERKLSGITHDSLANSVGATSTNYTKRLRQRKL